MKHKIMVLTLCLLAACQVAQASQCNTSEMSAQLEDAYKKDQDIRKELMPVLGEYQKTGKGAFKLIRLSKKQDRLDKENQEMLGEWMQVCGWPDELTPKAHNTVFLILQHSNLELMNQYIGELKKKVDKGILPPDDYAAMSDRIAMNEGRAQKFGTQTFQMSNSGGNVNTVWPVVNQDSLNTWRAGVGLPTMEQYFAIARDSLGVEMVMDSTLTLDIANRIRGN